MKANEICHVGPTSFHGQLGDERYPFEDRRYWLFTSKLCPFAHRTEIVRALKHAGERVGLTIAGAIQTAAGWNLGERYESEDSEPNPVAGVDRVPGVYEVASPGYDGRASVPVLFDTKTGTIVNNESAEIIRQFDREFSTEASPALYPEKQRDEIDRVSQFLDDALISPIYRAGFAKDQESYQQNFNSVFHALDAIEERLGKSGPYLVGEDLTLADVHAFPHLSRFDAVYHSLYRLNANFIRDYPHLSEYMGQLAEIRAFGETLDIEAVKKGYFLSWNQPTEGTFVPVGPPVDPRSGVGVKAARPGIVATWTTWAPQVHARRTEGTNA